MTGRGGFAHRLNLVLVEPGDEVENDEGQTAAEVNGLVHDEAHDASGEGVVLHPEIPSLEGRSQPHCNYVGWHRHAMMCEHTAQRRSK